LILSLPQKRWIFTNADDQHAMRVLAALGLSDCFHGIIDIRAIQFACKPERIAYKRALVIAGSPQPGQCMLLDDSTANLMAARQSGFTTVLVNQNGASDPGVDYVLKDLRQLRQALPLLWQAEAAGGQDG
jgi:pyrimidine 5'-nucleotidase